MAISEYEFLKSDKKKIEILSLIKDGKWYSYHYLHTKLGMFYYTAKRELNFLETLGFVEINRLTKENTASGKASYSVRITEKGKEWLSKMRNYP